MNVAILKRPSGVCFNVGAGYPTAVMGFVGMTRPRDLNVQLRKIDALAAVETPPEIIADLSIIPGRNSLVPTLFQRGFVAAALPVYSVVPRNGRIDRRELLSRSIELVDAGARLLTIHATPTSDLIEMSARRLVPWTSRGGGLVIEDLLRGGGPTNAYLDILPDLLSVIVRKDVTISLGASFRAANIFDACDEVQMAEIEAQVALAEKLRVEGVSVIIESPGHARPRDISRLASKLSATGYPIMPLGPIPTDAAIGQDHIAASIGATLLGLGGAAHVLTVVTREEHTGGIPTIGSTLEALRAARVAAHIIDIDQLDAVAEDYRIAIERADGHSCVFKSQTPGCNRCGRACPL